MILGSDHAPDAGPATRISQPDRPPKREAPQPKSAIDGNAVHHCKQIYLHQPIAIHSSARRVVDRSAPEPDQDVLGESHLEPGNCSSPTIALAAVRWRRPIGLNAGKL